MSTKTKPKKPTIKELTKQIESMGMMLAQQQQFCNYLSQTIQGLQAAFIAKELEAKATDRYLEAMYPAFKTEKELLLQEIKGEEQAKMDAYTKALEKQEEIEKANMDKRVGADEGAETIVEGKEPELVPTEAAP